MISTLSYPFSSVKNYCFYLILILLFHLGIAQNKLETTYLRDGDSILFIGNSNVGSEGGLQHHFRRAVAKAKPALSIATHWMGMYDRPTLAEMYSEELIDRITQGTDDYYVISSGPTEAMVQFTELIRRQQKPLVFFAEWANNPYLEDGNLEAFREETQKEMDRLKQFESDRGVLIVPTGMIFYDLIVDPIPFSDLRPDYLYVPGGSVQNDLGTLVNLAAIYAITTGNSPVGLPLWVPYKAELVTSIEERVWSIVKNWRAGKTKLRPIPRKQTIVFHRPRLSATEPLWVPLLKEGDRIFYVGNSFIGTEGGLENHFKRLLAEIIPPMKIETSSRIFWGQGLRSMHTDEVREEMAKGENDIVVVTSGPDSLLNLFRKEIHDVGSQMVVHMTWGWNPTINQEGMEGFRNQTIRITNGMKTFEKETGVPVVPCGLILYDLVVDPPMENLRLDWVFMEENIHQNHIGTMANTAAHYAVMTGRSPVGLPMWDPYPRELVQLVQERVWKIVQDWKMGKVEVKPIPNLN